MSAGHEFPMPINAVRLSELLCVYPACLSMVFATLLYTSFMNKSECVFYLQLLKCYFNHCLVKIEWLFIMSSLFSFLLLLVIEWFKSMENVCNSEINQLMKACKCVDCNGSFHQGCVQLVTGNKVSTIIVRKCNSCVL